MSTDLEPDERPWEAIGWLTSSQYRRDVLQDLVGNGPATPKELHDATGHSMASISHALSQLRERGHVDLLVSEDRRKGRIYGATEQGGELASHATEGSR